jgi:hypothetical protein
MQEQTVLLDDADYLRNFTNSAIMKYLDNQLYELKISDYMLEHNVDKQTAIEQLQLEEG